MPEGIFRNDPPPQQGRRFVPIPAQGNDPPRRSIALGMAVVLASWPTGLEYQPQRRVPTVPIPAQGQRPPPYSTVNLNSVLRPWWAAAGEYQPLRTIPTVPIPAQGDDPPRFSTANVNAVLRTWLPPDPDPRQLPRTFAPLTLTYGDQPPPLVRREIQRYEQEFQQQRQALVAALIPAATVEQPSFTRQPESVLAAWQAEFVRGQQRRAVAPIPDPPTTIDDPPPRTLAKLLATLQLAWIPHPPLLRQRAISVAGLLPAADPSKRADRLNLTRTVGDGLDMNYIAADRLNLTRTVGDGLEL